MAQDLDVLCLGEPLVEFSQEADGRYARGFGGDVSNVAIAVARSGGAAGIATRLGADAFGDGLAALWAEEGVDAGAVERDAAAATGLYFVTHGPEGHRFDYLRRGSAASRMAPGWPDDAVLGRARVLHVSGIGCAISDTARDAVADAVDRARGLGVRISYDTNHRPKLWDRDVAAGVTADMLSRADIALPSLEDAEVLFGLDDPQAVLDRVLGLGPQVVALTMGAGGVWIATPEGRWHIPAADVAAVDANGAGDTFDGYFLSGVTAGDDLMTAARRGIVAAGIAVTRAGAVAGIPWAEEVAAVS